MFTFDTDHNGRPARTAPVKGAWHDNPRFIAAGLFAENGKEYRVEIRHGRDWSLTVHVWNKGRAVPESTCCTSGKSPGRPMLKRSAIP